MDGWLFNLCASNDVEIVADYQQSQDPAALKDDLTSGGWCLGMVMDWLRCKRNSIDFWDSFESGEGRKRVRFVMARQRIAGKKGNARDVADKMKVALGAAGLTLQTSEREDVGHVSAANLYNSLAKCRGRYISLIIGGAGGSHAIGILISQTQIVFMDPNSGELVFPNKATFRRWLSVYLTGMNYFGGGLLSEYQLDAFG